jgi:hypothetical protein
VKGVTFLFVSEIMLVFEFHSITMTEVESNKENSRPSLGNTIKPLGTTTSDRAKIFFTPRNNFLSSVGVSSTIITAQKKFRFDESRNTTNTYDRYLDSIQVGCAITEDNIWADEEEQTDDHNSSDDQILVTNTVMNKHLQEVGFVMPRLSPTKKKRVNKKQLSSYQINHKSALHNPCGDQHSPQNILPGNSMSTILVNSSSSSSSSSENRNVSQANIVSCNITTTTQDIVNNNADDQQRNHQPNEDQNDDCQENDGNNQSNNNNSQENNNEDQEDDNDDQHEDDQNLPFALLDDYPTYSAAQRIGMMQFCVDTLQITQQHDNAMDVVNSTLRAFELDQIGVEM